MKYAVKKLDDTKFKSHEVINIFSCAFTWSALHSVAQFVKDSDSRYFASVSFPSNSFILIPDAGVLLILNFGGKISWLFTYVKNTTLAEQMHYRRANFCTFGCQWIKIYPQNAVTPATIICGKKMFCCQWQRHLLGSMQRSVQIEMNWKPPTLG